VKGSGVNAVVRYLHTLFEVRAVAGLSDGQLLDCFIARQEGAALEALVRRHGPMVWGVCRHVLRDHHDAEDAFQATFLVLTRRAASIRPREKVGNWRYGVAHQTARKARATRARRRVREGQVPDAPEPEAVSNAPRDELAELIDHELSRLPDKYRTPIVLCELVGKTHREAAQRLGWPIRTVSGRLSRAKAMLAKRLSRRGVSLAALLAQIQVTASAGVPVPLQSSTVMAASLFAAGRTATAGVASSEAAVLAGKVLQTMLLTKIKITTAITAAALLAFTLAEAAL
jgi:RNA polymerase sigma-70 factor (ECF subfamily)